MVRKQPFIHVFRNFYWVTSNHATDSLDSSGIGGWWQPVNYEPVFKY